MKKIILALSMLSCVPLAGCGHQQPAVLSISPYAATRPVVVASGVLCVQLQGVTHKPFSVLSTVQDIASLRITVSGAGLSSALVQQFTAADISAGNTSALFSSLPAGPVTVQVSAYDSRGVLLGATSAAATVVARQTTTVCLVVTLNSNVGNLGVGVTFVEVTPTVEKAKVDCQVCQ